MTTITATPLAGDFNTALFNFLKTDGIEGFEPFVYTDSRNIPTLGVGYALVTGSPGHWQVRANYQSEFAASGINHLTASQLNVLQTSLQDAADSLNGVAGAVNPFRHKDNVLDWTITAEPQALALFNTIIPQYEATVKTWLGDDAIYNSLLGSREMLVLESLAYNGFFGAGKSPSLHKAIIDGNRAEAWYEIRFNTSTANITRDYAQGAIFGLYEPGNITKDEALSVYQMYTKYYDSKNGLAIYDKAHESLIASANNILSTAGIPGSSQKLELELRRAADTIETEYLKPNNLSLGTINPLNIQISSDGKLDLTGEDDTTRTGHIDDLLIGDANGNTLEGRSGNDILLGEDGADTLTGGTGNDTLVGGKGNDILLGEDGNDTYVYTSGDGLDTIVDSDGLGVIVMDVLEMHGKTGVANDNWIQAGDAWQDRENHTSYSLIKLADDSQDLAIVTPNGATRIKNWRQGDLGITLGAPQAATPPSPSEPIKGDLKPIDTNPAQEGVQEGKNELDNIIVGMEVEANRQDTLFDSTGDDVLQGLGGKDFLHAKRGGNDTLEGGEDSDILLDTGGDNLLYADQKQDFQTFNTQSKTAIATGQRGDLLGSGAGKDTLFGGNGQDALAGGDGADIMHGGADDDIIYGDGIFTAANPNWGITVADVRDNNVLHHAKQLIGVTFQSSLQGGDDVIYGGSGNDYIDGGASNNILVGGTGRDILIGGKDNDILYTEEQTLVDSGLPNKNNEYGDFLSGGKGNDTLIGSDKADALMGGEGDDLLIGGDGHDIIFGGGDYVTTTYDWTIRAQAQVYAAADESTPGWGNGIGLSPINPDGSYDVGIGGNDLIYGGGGGDWILAGRGDDMVYGDNGIDSIIGGAGNDILYGGGDADALNGGTGNDTLDGGAGADFLSGGAGADIFLNVDDGDKLLDNDGNDAVIFKDAGGLAATQAMTLSGGKDLLLKLDNGAAINMLSVFGGSHFTLKFGNGSQMDLETEIGNTFATALNLALGNSGGRLFGGAAADNLSGGYGDDTLNGHLGNDSLNGKEGNDILNGGAGADALSGDGGDDILDGGIGIDILLGGAGNDTYFLDANSGGDVINDSEGGNIIRLTGNMASTLAASLAGTATNPTLTLSADGVQIAALNGALGNYRFELDDGTQLGLDEFLHNYRADALAIDGDENGNTLYGGQADDTLYGNGGGDTLIGGRGDDFLDGGAGNDTYLFSTTGGHDVISWQNDEAIGDRIVFDAGIQYADLNINGLANGDLVIAINNQDASLTLKGWFNNPSHPTQFQFHDGTVVSQDDISAWRVAPITGTAGADTLTGTDFDDVIEGLGGNDTLNGGGGNDSLAGGSGRDTYILQLGGNSPGNGVDTVTETGGETSVIRLANADLGGLVSQRSGNDLRLAILGGGGEGLLLKDYYAHTAGWGVVDYTGAEQALAAVLADNENRRANMGGMALLEEEYAADWRAAMIKNRANGATQLADGRLELKPIVNFNYYQTQSMDLSGNVTASDGSGSFYIEPWVFSSFSRHTITSNDAEIYLDTLDSDFQYVSNNALVDVALENWQLTTTSNTNKIYSPNSYVYQSYLVTLPPGASGFSLGSGYTAIPTGIPGQYLLTGYELVPGSLTGYRQNTSISGRTNVLSLNPSVGAEPEAAGLGQAALNHRPVPQNLALSLNRLDQDFSLTALNAGDGDNGIYVRTTQDLRNVVHAGGGNDIIHVGMTSGSPDSRILVGMFLDGGAGNDTIIGEIDDDLIIGGSGNDVLEGGSGSDRYYLMPGDVGTDLIFDAVNEYIYEYGYGGNYSGSNDSNTVVFGEGVDLSNFTLSWGTYNYEDIQLYQTLDITWQADSVVRIAMPRADENGYSVKTGVQFFEFADGNRMTMAQMLALADPAPNMIIGSFEDDQLIGGVGNDVIDGGYGNDTLIGGAGDDTIYGYQGNDKLDGGIGADTLAGGADDDTYVVDNILDIVVEKANEGTDTVQSSVGYTLSDNVENLTLAGTTAIDGTGNALDNVLIGNSAANTLDGAAGADTLIGGNGDDTYIVDNTLDMVVENANEGIDTVRTSEIYTLGDNVENLTLTDTAAINGTGNALDNVIIGNNAANTLIGDAGNDRLDGGVGTDTLLGGIGDDVYVVDATTDVVAEDANAGTDTIETEITYTLGANVENLTLTGAAAINGIGNTLNNVLIGNSANNKLSGGTGADAMIGGDGNDIYVVDNALDVVTEKPNEGADLVKSSLSYILGDNIEKLTLTGTSAINGIGNALDNVLTGNSAANTLVGNAGNDKLVGGAGIDMMSGGIGDDTYVVENTLDVVTENFNEGTDLVQSSVTYTLSANVENLTLTGTAASNGTGNSLDNVLTGNSAGNVLVGDAGNDKLVGGTGADTLVGGMDDDIYVVDNTLDVVVESLNEGIDLVQSNLTYTLSDNVENLTLIGTAVINGTGNALDNILTGNSAANTLLGDAGNDRLVGGAGADTMIGGTGNDTYVVDILTDIVSEDFNEGTDTVETGLTYTLGSNIENLKLTGTAARNGIGNSLDNTLIGNSAINSLSGGAGNDTLDGLAGADTLTGGIGNDTYKLGRGHGIDTVVENDATSGNTDIAQFLSGITNDQIWFRHVANNLEVSVIGTSDKLVVKDWYLGFANHVEQFKATDGAKTLLDSEVENLVSAMAAFAPPAAGQTTLPANYQAALAPALAANWQ